MRKLLIIAVVVVVSLSNVYTQNCKPAYLKVDEFTGEKIVAWGGKLGSARSQWQGVSQSLTFYVGEVNGKLLADITVQYQQKENDASVNEIDIPKGSEFMLKTTDGIVSFVSSQSKRIKRKAMGYKITVVSLTAEITMEQLENLSNNLITMYRIVPEETEAISGKVNVNKATKLREQFNCFLNEKKKVNNEETEDIEIVEDEFVRKNNTNKEKQKEIGGGFAYFGGLFLEAKANFGIFNAISVSPSFDFYLGNALDNMIIFGVDGHYNFFLNKDFTLYPLLGLSFVRYKGFRISDSFMTVNIGGGMNYAVSDKIKIYSELKYVSGFAFTAGVLVSL